MTTTTLLPEAASAGTTGTTGAAVDRAPRVWTAAATSGAIAAAATTVAAAIVDAFGADVAVGGEQIPLSGFAMLTAIGAVLGLGIAKIAQRTSRPRRTFVATTVVLTAASIVPDLVADTTWGIRLFLTATHLLAAVIIVPAVAGRLAD